MTMQGFFTCGLPLGSALGIWWLDAGMGGVVIGLAFRLGKLKIHLVEGLPSGNV